MSDEQKWYEVRAIMRVRAADEDDAVDRIATRLRGAEKISGLFPVGAFDVAECEDPTLPQRRVTPV